MVMLFDGSLRAFRVRILVLLYERRQRDMILIPNDLKRLKTNCNEPVCHVYEGI